MKKFAAIIAGLVFATAASGETSLPEGVEGYMELPSISPIPRTCRPRKAEVSLFVLSDAGVLPVIAASGIDEFSGSFDLTGMFLFDTDNIGRPEAYGFGTVRSEMGGGYPSNLWIDNIDLRVGEYSENFSQGILLDHQYQGSGLPTLVIALAEWQCAILARPNGDIANN